MNMLVAIMGQTFNDVTEASEESGLFEQITLIEDFVGLVDHKVQFNKCRYIIKVELMQQTQENDTRIRDLLT